MTDTDLADNYESRREYEGWLDSLPRSSEDQNVDEWQEAHDEWAKNSEEIPF